MESILLIGYIVFLLIALIYSGIIIFHVVKYHREDLYPVKTQHARKALWIYVIISSIILMASIITAIVLFVSN